MFGRLTKQKEEWAKEKEDLEYKVKFISECNSALQIHDNEVSYNHRKEIEVLESEKKDLNKKLSDCREVIEHLKSMNKLLKDDLEFMKKNNI